VFLKYANHVEEEVSLAPLAMPTQGSMTGNAYLKGQTVCNRSGCSFGVKTELSSAQVELQILLKTNFLPN
jgi:hypothetical protein